MLELEDSFAIWYDSPYSCRIYVYSVQNYDEVFSDRIYLPLHEWVNLQITIDYSTGITAMTFNHNGAML